ncbi:hypothetical protein JCM10450v2_006496 [Rhodotorula kratochvilovae]
MPSVRHYLDLGHLRRLDEYRYSAVDKSPLSRFVLRHWWTWSAGLMPPWLAPNLITLIGFAAVALNFVSVALVCPTLAGSESAWLWATCAAGLFFYQMMDNIDGKQARRTGTSSPMGELFDHGCDALNTPLSALIQAAALGLGTSPLSLLCIAIACMSFFASTWEEYHTGTLYLGYINGPVEGILLAVFILVWTGIKGSSWWSLPVRDTLGEAFFLPSSWRTNRLVVFLLSVAFLALHLPPCLHNVHTLLRPSPRRALTRSHASARLNATPPGEAFAQLLPIAGFCALAGVWALSPWSKVREAGRVPELVVIVALLYGQMTSKVILAQLTKGLFPHSWALLLPLALPAVLVNVPLLGLPALLPPLLEAWYLHLLLLLSLLSYALSAHAVLSAFCGYLGIRALRIPYPNAACEGYVALASTARAHQSPAIGAPSAAAEGEESEREEETFPPAPIPPASSSPLRPARAAAAAQKWLDPSHALRTLRESAAGGGGEGEGGRKRSNTSERERGVGMHPGEEGMGEGRRIARV